jgi:hypothetical protein
MRTQGTDHANFLLRSIYPYFLQGYKDDNGVPTLLVTSEPVDDLDIEAFKTCYVIHLTYPPFYKVCLSTKFSMQAYVMPTSYI